MPRGSSAWPPSWGTWRRSRAATGSWTSRSGASTRTLPTSASRTTPRRTGKGWSCRARPGPTPVTPPTPRPCDGSCGSRRRSRSRAPTSLRSWRSPCGRETTRSACWWCAASRPPSSRKRRRTSSPPWPATSPWPCAGPRARPPPSTWPGRWPPSMTWASKPPPCATCGRSSSRPRRRRAVSSAPTTPRPSASTRRRACSVCLPRGPTSPGPSPSPSRPSASARGSPGGWPRTSSRS